MRKSIFAVGLTWICLSAAITQAAELQPRTLNAWNQYIAAVQAHIRDQAASPDKFLWADKNPRQAERLKHGEPAVAPVIANGSKAVPDGLIHDWIGATFIPDTSIDRVLHVLRDYGHYKEFYNPQITDSEVIEISDRGDQFSMRWIDKVLLLSAAIDTQYRVQNVRLSNRRFYRVSFTTKVQQLENAGQRGECKLPPDQGDGYLWRLYSDTKLEERDGGVYLEIEAIALTRDVPFALRPFVSPVIRRLSRDSMLVSLQKTREAVNAAKNLSNPGVSTAQSERTAQRKGAYSRSLH